MPNWQPIETAPRDGTMIILYAANWTEKCGFNPWVGRWRDMQDFEYGKLVRERAYWSGGDTYLFVGKDATPTHWMPLPDPPEAGAVDPQANPA